MTLTQKRNRWMSHFLFSLKQLTPIVNTDDVEVRQQLQLSRASAVALARRALCSCICSAWRNWTRMMRYETIAATICKQASYYSSDPHAETWLQQRVFLERSNPFKEVRECIPRSRFAYPTHSVTRDVTEPSACDVRGSGSNDAQESTHLMWNQISKIMWICLI